MLMPQFVEVRGVFRFRRAVFNECPALLFKWKRQLTRNIGSRESEGLGLVI